MRVSHKGMEEDLGRMILLKQPSHLYWLSCNGWVVQKTQVPNKLVD